MKIKTHNLDAGHNTWTGLSLCLRTLVYGILLCVVVNCAEDLPSELNKTTSPSTSTAEPVVDLPEDDPADEEPVNPPAPRGPAIATPPASQTVANFGSVTFSVVATSSGTASYQWYFNGAEISGARSASYSINPVSTTHTGAYSVKVSDEYGNVTSTSATLTVTVPSPSGSYSLSCDSCTTDTSTFLLSCTCRAILPWVTRQTSIYYNQCPNSSVGNSDGYLTCGT
ncbi:MAG: immunoglobulin domain-containing protein [Bdellovibrionales bacterium]